MKKRIAVIGGGIVGSTCAFYLAKAGHNITLFDDGTGQATKAAAGIISPWLSQRRNKVWYRLTANGASFYQTLLSDLQSLGYNTDFYQQNGTLVFKKSDKLLDKITNLAHQRREIDTLIGDLKRMSVDDLTTLMPELTPPGPALFASGGALIDGKDFIDTLHQASSQFDFHFVNTKVDITSLEFDAIVLAVGAWLPECLAPFGLKVDVRAQKGQLFSACLSNQQTDNYPVLMPQSEIDLLPFKNGKWVIGATHENDMGFDLTPDLTVLEQMKAEASHWLPELDRCDMEDIRVGTRAYTSDYTPFFGSVPYLENIYTASGLGASGLTSGAYIGYLLSELIQEKELPMDITPYSPSKYITK
ncbi:FAD-dependent oxidoreductase [Granulicatella sp. zg-ZJ]|uniref:NAD(P)/FAD-dependent oxidoreductase n=1 Tax=Granulicatella sp. zg-ZJ TaxID=2678504 RepID=UPI0013D6B73F|nr:FAD-binding oxidoreductase [Granulicatella sp. zg-ZJ]NEW63080.1 FAD-dependent oxidoreductase [Granulicatella sp. zg-ZJ]